MHDLNEYGLPEKSYQMILEAIASFPEIEEAQIFGSSVMGNYKCGSDVDPAIKGEKVDFETH